MRKWGVAFLIGVAFCLVPESARGGSVVKGLSLRLVNGIRSIHQGDFRILGRTGADSGLLIEGEAILHIGARLGIGFSGGYTRSKDRWGDTYRSIRINPIRLSVFYFLPASTHMNLYLRGGALYCASETHYVFHKTENLRILSMNYGTVHDRGWGGQAAAGAEIEITSRFFLFLEAGGRVCRLRDWKGSETWDTQENDRDHTLERSGSLWYADARDINGEGYYSTLLISKEAPASHDFRNARRFEVDLSGFAVRAGIRIRF